ncbi:MAG: SMI1/KNR4 family protein [Actinomycetaceae bacterium]|nr:SMI1/KNR4 family protein [Actinomycetaceae bacterium]
MFSSVQVEGTPRGVTQEDLNDLEEELATPMPSGYREYMSTLGNGQLAGHIHIYTPSDILEGPWSMEKWKKRLREDGWEWDEELIDEERAEECVFFGETADGDELVFHPDDPEVIYLLPAESATVRYVADGLFDALEVLMESPLGQTSGSWDFVPVP